MDVAMATIFLLSTGGNFGCMIASDTLFDSVGGLNTTKIECVRVVAVATNFGTKTAITGFV